MPPKNQEACFIGFLEAFCFQSGALSGKAQPILRFQSGALSGKAEPILLFQSGALSGKVQPILCFQSGDLLGKTHRIDVIELSNGLCWQILFPYNLEGFLCCVVFDFQKIHSASQIY